MSSLAAAAAAAVAGIICPVACGERLSVPLRASSGGGGVHDVGAASAPTSAGPPSARAAASGVAEVRVLRRPRTTVAARPPHVGPGRAPPPAGRRRALAGFAAAAPAAPLMLLLRRAPLAAAQFSKPFGEIDENGDGVVDKEEYMLAARDMFHTEGLSSDVRKQLYRYFEKVYTFCDFDGDGVLNDREIEYSDYLGSKDNGVAAYEIDPTWSDIAEYDLQDDGEVMAEVLEDIDTDGDGRVAWPEFVHAVQGDLINWGWLPETVAHPLSLALVREVFDKADIIPDESLGAKELQFAGYLVFDLAAREWAHALAWDFDANGDGLVQRQEIQDNIPRAPLLPNGRASIGELIHRHFDEADYDQDGSLGPKERLRLAMKVLMGTNTYGEE